MKSQKKKVKRVRVSKKKNIKISANEKFNIFYRDVFSYLKESQNFIYGIVILFFLSAIIGFIFHTQFEIFNDVLRNIAESVQDLSAIQLVFFIFINNIQAALIGFIFGPLLGIAPVLNAIFNGSILGYVSYLAILSSGPLIMLQLLPHGIFELPAIFISLGMGLRWSTFIFAPKEKVKEMFMYHFRNGLKVFVGVVIPLLAIGAVIEGILIAISTPI